jgi:hypothetical protein
MSVASVIADVIKLILPIGEPSGEGSSPSDQRDDSGGPPDPPSGSGHP